MPNSSAQSPEQHVDAKLRQYIYHFLIREGKAPTIEQIRSDLKSTTKKIRAGLRRLAEAHAFVLQENGELWRAAPFSAVPTAFPVHVGKNSWYGNCIWDALGISAMLHKDARIGASCGCCNYDMALEVKNGKLLGPKGIIHFAVPPRQWYNDIVFT